MFWFLDSAWDPGRIWKIANWPNWEIFNMDSSPTPKNVHWPASSPDITAEGC